MARKRRNRDRTMRVYGHSFDREACRGRRSRQGLGVGIPFGELIAIPYSYRAPWEFAATNIQGTINLLEACRAHGVERMIHTPTSEVYGTARYTPIDEEHPFQAQSPYSASKISADKMVEAIIAVTTCRCVPQDLSMPTGHGSRQGRLFQRSFPRPLAVM